MRFRLRRRHILVIWTPFVVRVRRRLPYSFSAFIHGASTSLCEDLSIFRVVRSASAASSFIAIQLARIRHRKKYSARNKVIMCWRIKSCTHVPRISLHYYGTVLLRRRPHHVSILSVCLSVRLSRAYFFLRIVLGTWALTRTENEIPIVKIGKYRYGTAP